MVAGEEYERQVKTAEHSVIALETDARVEREKIQMEQASLQQELQVKESGRREITSEIPEDLLHTYEQIARRRHGIGVAEVREEACGLCGVRIRPHVFQELRRNDCHDIFQCETCTRILYYVEPPAATPPDTGSKASAAGISANEA